MVAQYAAGDLDRSCEVAVTPTCVWRTSTALIAAIDTAFGDPMDAYVNGSQTWLEENGPGGVTIEWRLHPVPGYRRPDGVDTYAVFRSAADGAVDPATLWDGLEAFPAHDDPTTPAELRAAAIAAIGVEPTAWGVVDHEPIGDEWERTGGAVSVVERLLEQLASTPGGDAE
jgi:hypothetical protein